MRLVLDNLVVHDQALFMPGGDVHNWVHEVASELFFYAQREAPINKRPNKTAGHLPVGSLHAGLRSDVDRIGLKVFTIDLYSTAYYSKWVIKGTNTIYRRGARGYFGAAQEGRGMYLPTNPGFGPGRWRQRVRGQRANNFLGRAYDDTALRHPALKGMSA